MKRTIITTLTALIVLLASNASEAAMTSPIRERPTQIPRLKPGYAGGKSPREHSAFTKIPMRQISESARLKELEFELFVQNLTKLREYAQDLPNRLERLIKNPPILDYKVAREQFQKKTNEGLEVWELVRSNPLFAAIDTKSKIQAARLASTIANTGKNGELFFTEVLHAIENFIEILPEVKMMHPDYRNPEEKSESEEEESKSEEDYRAQAVTQQEAEQASPIDLATWLTDANNKHTFSHTLNPDQIIRQMTAMSNGGITKDTFRGDFIRALGRVNGFYLPELEAMPETTKNEITTKQKAYNLLFNKVSTLHTMNSMIDKGSILMINALYDKLKERVLALKTKQSERERKKKTTQQALEQAEKLHRESEQLLQEAAEPTEPTG